VVRGQRFVAGQARFLEGVRERVVADVVQQGGEREKAPRARVHRRGNA